MSKISIYVIGSANKFSYDIKYSKGSSDIAEKYIHFLGLMLNVIPHTEL